MLRKLIPMQRSLLLILLVTVTVITEAQVKRGNPPVPPANNADTAVVTDIREKLIQLALQNPDYEIADREITIAHNNLKLTKTKFLNNLIGQINYNEYSIKAPTDNFANYYPKYNIGLSIPFGIFPGRGKEINIAKENVGIAEANKNLRFRQIKAAVLTAYEDYLMHKQKLEFQNQITQDVRTLYQQKERDFSEGIISAEEYYPAYHQWTDEQSKRTELQRNFNVAKVELEMLIGMTLEEAIAK
jgi:outer membrane protein TolC